MAARRLRDAQDPVRRHGTDLRGCRHPLGVGRDELDTFEPVAPPCKVDATGLGQPVVEQLKEAGVAAQPVIFTSKVKTAIVKNLQVLLERGRIVLPERALCPELHDELEQFMYLDEDGSDHRKMGAPHGSHDDAVVALALCASYFYGSGIAGRYHRAGARGSPLSSAQRETFEIKRRESRETVYIDVPAPIVGGFKSRTGRPAEMRRAHTPRRSAGRDPWRLGRGVFETRHEDA